MNRFGPRSGLTLVELLVTISIIAVLLAILFPAVQSIRQSARRTICGSQLRQTGMAIASYSSVKGHLPAGRIGCDDTGELMSFPDCRGNLSPQQKNGASGFVSLLPLIELQTLFDQLDIANGGLWNRDVDDLDWYDIESKNRGVKVRVPLWVCPSDESRGTSDVYFPVWAATSSYAFVSGSIGPDSPDVIQKYENNGAFIYRRARRTEEVRDGLSNTLFVGEVVNSDHWESSNIWNYALANADCLRTTANPLNTAPGQGIVAERRNGTFGSRHPQGGQFVFGDGSVKFISDSIDLTTYQALSTIHGREVISFDE